MHKYAYAIHVYKHTDEENLNVYLTSTLLLHLVSST